MSYDSSTVYLKQLDNKGLPEVVIRCFYRYYAAGRGGAIDVSEEDFYIWNLDSGTEIFQAWPAHAYHQWESYSQDDTRVSTFPGIACGVMISQ